MAVLLSILENLVKTAAVLVLLMFIGWTVVMVGIVADAECLLLLRKGSVQRSRLTPTLIDSHSRHAQQKAA